MPTSAMPASFSSNSSQAISAVLGVGLGARDYARSWFDAGGMPQASFKNTERPIVSQEEAQGKLVLFAGIDKVRFKRVVRPGDTLDLRIEIIVARSSVGKAKMVATVQDELVCRGEVMFALVDAP